MSYLSLQTSLEQAENAIKQMEGFMNTMDANDEKINGVLQNADKLADEDHYNADKVGCVNISPINPQETKSLSWTRSSLIPICTIRRYGLHELKNAIHLPDTAESII